MYVEKVVCFFTIPMNEKEFSTMSETREKRKRFDGEEVEILGPTYEQGVPEAAGNWREKNRDRKEMLRYLQTSLRYWYCDDSFGSEKRRTPA
ncbi:MAG: hypothetical protein C4523_16185 [Myxococcales bacterium]|nr:MAG: hypothetical protein C4523_16185 [Myxococcales bacterium]